MPIYEFECRDCGSISSIFFRTMDKAQGARCPQCDSQRLNRLISRTFHVKGEAQRLAETDSRRLMSGLSDPRIPDRGEFARWSRRMSEELGSEMGAKYRELADKTEAEDNRVERIDPFYGIDHTLRERAEQVEKGSSTGGSEEAQGEG